MGGTDVLGVCCLPDPSKELKLLIAHLLEMLTREGASAHGRNNSLNLLIKVVPRKSLRDPNNSLTLWVIDQGKSCSEHPQGCHTPLTSPPHACAGMGPSLSQSRLLPESS